MGARLACLVCGACDARGFGPHYGRTVRCSVCAFVFLEDKPPTPDLHRIYRRDEYFRLGSEGGIGYADYFADAPFYRPYFARKVRRLRRLRTTGDLFEIGAAAGFFLDEARAAGWRTSGIEPSPAAALFGREVLRLDIAERTAEELPLVESQYDAVVLLQTIEHVSDPAGLLRWIHAALRRDGILLLTTPDVRSLTSRILGPWWPSYRPEHLWYFDRRTLPRLLLREGFRTISARADDPLVAPLSRIIERFGHFLGLPFTAVADRLPRRLAIPVWLGDLEVVARRLD